MDQINGLQHTVQTLNTASISESLTTGETGLHLRQEYEEPKHVTGIAKDIQDSTNKLLPDSLNCNGQSQQIKSGGRSSSRINEGREQAEEREEKMRGAVRTLLECLGEDPNREGLQATPSRYAKALLFLTTGYQDDLEEIVNGALFHEASDGLVIMKDIEIHSLCEHHILPFSGKMHIAYIPSNTVIGLSKLPRIAEAFSRRLQIQERLTQQVAHAVQTTLEPKGVAVVMESSHLCLEMRGVKKTGTTTITSCILGSSESAHGTLEKFLVLVGATGSTYDYKSRNNYDS